MSRVLIITLLALMAISALQAFRVAPNVGRRIVSSSSIFVKKAEGSAETPKREKIPLEEKTILSKSDVVSLLQQKTQFHKDDISKVLSTFADLIRDEVFEAGKEIRIKDFGTFKTRTRAPRSARNPRTGDTIKVSGKKALGFSPSSIFKADV